MYIKQDPRKSDKEHKYKHTGYLSMRSEDLTSDYMSILGMIFSMTGLMMRIKWCGWISLYCTCISYANCRFNYDNKQMISFFILSLSSIVMNYLQNPQPMTPPWSYEEN